LSFND